MPKELALVFLRKYNTTAQFIIALALVGVVALTCFFSVDFIGFRVVALILLLLVSILAMLFDMLPVLSAAFVSALLWNFFFIPPIFTFHVGTAEDALMFLMYFAVALINTVLSFKIREADKKVRDKEEKENTIRLYNTLLNSLSHELRTPVATIIGASDTLKETENNLSDKQKQDLLVAIETSATRLNRQVENLLNMSRLETGLLKPNRDWCDLNELIFTIINDCKSDAAHHKIIFDPDEKLPLIYLDRGLLEQALHNLVHNAVQYTPENSLITLNAEYNNAECIIIVTDNGNGFPESELTKVFDKFYRLPQSKAGGTGLGLSIAKGFVEAQGGEIFLENIASGGAKFTLVIPAESTERKSAENE